MSLLQGLSNGQVFASVTSVVTTLFVRTDEVFESDELDSEGLRGECSLRWDD